MSTVEPTRRGGVTCDPQGGALLTTYDLDQVFNEAAVPDLTFVRPREYRDLLASIRTRGKHVTISGPSGCGKTTLVKKTLADAGILPTAMTWLSGREYAEADQWEEIFSKEFGSSKETRELYGLMVAAGIIIIDDFHHLKRGVRQQIGSLLKLWHEKDVRVVVVGIAVTAHELLTVDSELGIRNDPYEMKSQDVTFCREVISRGETALNLAFADQSSTDFVTACKGIPSALQAICRMACVHENVTGTLAASRVLTVTLRDIRDSVLRIYRGKYFGKIVGLAKGKRQARSVHNMYFEIVKHICQIDKSEISAEELHKRIITRHADAADRPKLTASFYNCLNNLPSVIEGRGLADAMFFEKEPSRTISIEDPSFRFYLSLLDIEEVRKHIHIRATEYAYDVAVSFSSTVRSQVELFVRHLQERGLHVFYDFDEQHRLWGKNLGQKLAEVYATEAEYMVVFLSQDYPEKDWPTFELEIGRDAKKKRTREYLLPIIVDDVHIVGLSRDIGHVDLRRTSIEEAAKMLADKIEDVGDQPEAS
jgi:hypothetical protein